MQAGGQYLAEVRREYVRADDGRRTQLLDEAQKRTGMNRKYLIRLLNRAETPKRKGKRRKRGAEDGAAVVTALGEVWDIFEQPCGERLASVLRCETDRLRRLGELRCSEETAEKLKTVSASTRPSAAPREACSP